MSLKKKPCFGSVSQHVNGPSNSLQFKSDEKQMVWTINNLAGGEESTAHLRVRLVNSYHLLYVLVGSI